VAEEYIPFEDALRRLELQDAQLKRLISENEIKAYRDGERMKLKRDDVERLRSRLVGDVGGGQTEELVFEDDEMGEEPGMATVPLTEAETIVERPAPPRRPAAPPARATASAKATVAAPAKKAPAPRRVKSKEMPAEDAGTEGALFKGVLLVCFLALIVAIPFAFDNVKGYPGAISATFVKPKPQ
jgi:excisionase family DNA binding protein